MTSSPHRAGHDERDNVAAATYLTDTRQIREVYRNKYASGTERLTPHQARAYCNLAVATKDHAYVLGSRFGCVGALDRLVKKGRAERALVIGERGGWHYYYRAI